MGIIGSESIVVAFMNLGIIFLSSSLLNWKLQSVEGFKLDYPFLNLSGFTFYAISLTAGYISKGNLPFDNYGLDIVDIQDVVFAWHGVFINLVFNLQAIFYKRGQNKISKYSIAFAVFCWTTSILFYLVTEVYHVAQPTAKGNILAYLGDLKVCITLTKYAPLVYWNYLRKSTDGFSILAIFLDLTGGSLSILQSFLNVADGQAHGFNPAKLGLGSVSVFYDFVLLYQHYVLYGHNNKNNAQEEAKKPLLVSDRTEATDNDDNHLAENDLAL